MSHINMCTNQDKILCILFLIKYTIQEGQVRRTAAKATKSLLHGMWLHRIPGKYIFLSFTGPGKERQYMVTKLRSGSTVSSYL